MSPLKQTGPYRIENLQLNEMSVSESIPTSAIRGTLRLLLLIAAVLLLIPFCTLALFIAGLAGARARYRTVMALTPVVCGTMAWLIGIRLQIIGQPSHKALIFVGNHVSYLDILVAGMGVGGVFVSRHDVKSWPVIGIFARLAGTVFLDRSSLRSAIESSAGLVERAQQGIRIVLFPEGGTTPGDGVGSFKPFLFGAVAQESFLVQPFTIRYRAIGKNPITAENKHLVYWYDPAPSLDIHGWRLLKLKNVQTTIIFHEPVEPPHSSERTAIRRFAEKLQEHVASGLPEQQAG